MSGKSEEKPLVSVMREAALRVTEARIAQREAQNRKRNALLKRGEALHDKLMGIGGWVFPEGLRLWQCVYFPSPNQMRVVAPGDGSEYFAIHIAEGPGAGYRVEVSGGGEDIKDLYMGFDDIFGFLASWLADRITEPKEVCGE